MSKRAKIILGIIAIFFIVALIWFGKKNKTNIIEFETETAFTTTIVKKQWQLVKLYRWKK